METDNQQQIGPGSQQQAEKEKEANRNEELRDLCVEYLRTYDADMQAFLQEVELNMMVMNGDPLGDEVAGRSAYISTDAEETVEWIMPHLMRMFYGSNEVCSCAGHGPEDSEGAAALGDKVNWDFMKRQKGYFVIQDAFRDALATKIGVWKYWWDTEPIEEEKEFELFEAEIRALAANPNFKIEEIKPGQPPIIAIDSATGMEVVVQPQTYKVLTQTIQRLDGARAEAVPIEELVFDPKTKDISKENFICHILRKEIDDVVANYEIDKSDIIQEVDSFRTDTLRQQRYKDLGGINYVQDANDKNYVYLRECCVARWEGKRKRRYIVTLMGDQVLRVQKNKYNRNNYCFISPIRKSHREIGKSETDLVAQIQELRSRLTRYILDNLAYQTTGVRIIDEEIISADEFQDQDFPGGIVTKKQNPGADISKAIHIPQYEPLPPHAFAFLEKTEQIKENRSGMTRYTQGSDAGKSLNDTATGISAIMDASMARIVLIARNFAEGGFGDLLRQFAWMNTKFMNRTVNIRFDNRWTKIDPAKLDVAYDVEVSVTATSGNKDLQIQQLMALLQRAGNNMQIQIMTPKNIYEVEKLILTLQGKKDIDKFLTEPQPPQPMPGMMPGGPAGMLGSAAQGPVPGGQPLPAGPGNPMQALKPAPAALPAGPQ